MRAQDWGEPFRNNDQKLWKEIGSLKDPREITYAEVLLVEHRWTKVRKVIKVFPKVYLQQFKRELYVNSHLQSVVKHDRNIFALVHLYGNNQILEEFGPSTLVFDYAPRGSLKDLLEDLKRYRDAAGSRMTH